MRFFVVDVVGGKDAGRHEKRAWAAPLEMDGNLIWFAHTKFGVSATVYDVDTEEKASEIVADCTRRLGKAIPLVTHYLIEPLVEEAVASADFTVPNKFAYFYGMYSHLRSLAEATAREALTTEPEQTNLKNGGLSTHFGGADLARNAEYEAVGALFALFGLLEHLLVIRLAFVEYDPSNEPFDGFLRKNWGEKFKRVIGLQDKSDKLIYDMLRRLADENRNPSAHGGVDRDVSNVHVHLSGYGAVPTGVTSTSLRPTYTFEPELPKSMFPFAEHHIFGPSENGWLAVDEIITWMRTGPLSDAFAYAESGLPVWFDSASRENLRRAAASDELNEFLDRLSFMVDQASNMDW